MKPSRIPVLSSPVTGGLASLRRGKLRLALLAGALLASGALTRDALADEPLHVKDVKVASPADGSAEVLVVTTGSPQFTAHVADGGRRLVIDLAGADVAGAPGAITRGNAIVGGVMTQAVVQNGQRVTRVTVTLAHQAGYRITREPGGLRVLLSAAESTAPMEAGPSLQPVAAAVAVSNVRFDHQGGIDRVIVELSSRAEYSESTEAGRSVLELRGVRLPDALQRKLDTAAFGGPVSAVSTYRRKTDPGHVVIEVERSGDASGAVAREGNNVVFTFGRGKLPSSVSGDRLRRRDRPPHAHRRPRGGHVRRPAPHRDLLRRRRRRARVDGRARPGQRLPPHRRRAAPLHRAARGHGVQGRAPSRRSSGSSPTWAR